MIVFVTGGSGYIGSRVALAFAREGYDVRALVRSKEKGAFLLEEEILPVIGELKDVESYRAQIEMADVIVHAAAATGTEKAVLDEIFIDAVLQVTGGRTDHKHFIYTSGCFIYGNTDGKVFDEKSPINPIGIVKWRRSHEEKVLNAQDSHLKTLVLRPGFVYGGRRGWTDLWFESMTQGNIEMIGTGENCFSMVHRDDLARAYVLAAQKKVSGMVLNITDNEPVLVKEIVFGIAALGPALIRSIPYEEALKKMGPIAEGLSIDQKISSDKAIHLLGWRPHLPPMARDLSRYHRVFLNQSK